MKFPSLPGSLRSRIARSNADQDNPTRSATASRASDPLAKQIKDMKPPAGLPNTCPNPRGSLRGSRMAANIVSLVPKLITTVPGSVAPMPTKLLGLSPVNASTGVPGAKPNRATKYGAT